MPDIASFDPISVAITIPKHMLQSHASSKLTKHSRRYVAACGFIFCLIKAHSQDVKTPAGNAMIQVGGREIVIPAPSGFERIDGIDKTWDDLVAAGLPPSNKFLAHFGTLGEAADMRAGNTPTLQRSFNVQIVRTLETRDIGLRDFERAKSELKTELKALEARLEMMLKEASQAGSSKMKKVSGLDVAFDISDTVMLGIFEDSSTSLGFTMGMKVGVGVDGANEETKMVVAGIVVPVNGRLLNLYASADYRDEADRKWAEEAALAWRDLVVTANPTLERGKGFGGINWHELGKSGGRGAAIGLGVALVLGLAKWFRRKSSGSSGGI